MPILNAVIESLDTLGDKLCELDLSQPRYNMSALGVSHIYEANNKPSFVVRDAEPHEAKLVAPGTKGVYEDMLSRIGVQHANLGVEADKDLDAQAFEEFYDKTVDLADLCQLPEVNERLNQVANSYQELSARKEELSSELKRLAVIPRIKQRLAKQPQMEKEKEETVAQRQKMEIEAEAHTREIDSMEKDISYMRMEHTMDQESEEQAIAQLQSKKNELEQLQEELANKKHLLDTRKDIYRKKRPLTAVEHAERMRDELNRTVSSDDSQGDGDGSDMGAMRDRLAEKLSEIIGNTEAIGVTNQFIDKVFAKTIDGVANEDVDSLEGRRTSRRLSMSVSVPSGRVLAAQLLCILYSRQNDSEQTAAMDTDDSGGMTEDELRALITEFSRERQWNPDLAVQAMYEVLGKKLAKRYRENRTHMVRLLWS